MRPIDIACRECASQPGQPCRDYSTFVYIWLEMKDFHSQRVEDALAWGQFANKPGDEPIVEQFNKAVEDSDLL